MHKIIILIFSALDFPLQLAWNDIVIPQRIKKRHIAHAML